MGKEAREQRREKRRVKGHDRERLAAAEVQIAELVDARIQLVAELANAREEFLGILEAQANANLEQHAAVQAQVKEDYRRQVGVLDMVRRQQKRQDETFGARVEATEQALSAVAAEQTTRIGGLESRADHLETTTRVAVHRIEGFEAFQAELGTIIERVNDTLRAIRDAVEKLAGRTDQLEAFARQQLTDHAALREQVVTGQHANELLADSTRRAAAALADLDQQLQTLVATVAPLGPIPERLSELTETINTMNDRVVAAELVLNQRNDLDLQLERAEEFERVLAEVDPAAYASRQDLEALRSELNALREESHTE